MRRCSAARSGGLTLVEVLVGLVLLGMLMTLVANGVRLGTRAWSKAETVTADRDDLEAVRSLMRRTISRAEPVFASSDLKNLTILFNGEPNAMTLVAPQPATQGNGPPAVQRFSLGRAGDGQGLFLRWQLLAPGGPVGDPRQALVLDSVASVRFAYFGPAADGQPPAWQERWVERDRLPQLVRVSVVRSGRGSRVWPDLILATRVTTNATCLYDASSSLCRRVR